MLYIWIVVLMAGTCAGAEKLLSAVLAEDSTTNLALNDTNHVWSTNRIDYHWTAIGVSHVLTTNVSERFPAPNQYQQPQFYPEGPIMTTNFDWVYPNSDPKKKWVRTTIKRQTFVDFTLDGTPFRGLLKEETLFDKEVEWVLHRQDEWNEK